MDGFDIFTTVIQIVLFLALMALFVLRWLDVRDRKKYAKHPNLGYFLDFQVTDVTQDEEANTTTLKYQLAIKKREPVGFWSPPPATFGILYEGNVTREFGSKPFKLDFEFPKDRHLGYIKYDPAVDPEQQ